MLSILRQLSFDIPGPHFRNSAWPLCRARVPALIGGLALAAAVSSAAVGADELRAEPEYLVGAGDSLLIDVYRQPELSTAVTVRPDGRISLPLVEDMMVAGRTTVVIADEIEQALSAYVLGPLVVVSVQSATGYLPRQVRVVGDAMPPYAVPYRTGMTALDVIVAGGGLAPGAAGNEAVIIRRTAMGTTRIPVRLGDLIDDGRVAANIAMAPGDVLLIPEGFFAGERTFEWGLSVTQSYTDNVDLEPDDEAEAALITEVRPFARIGANAARIQGALIASLSGRQQMLSDAGHDLEPELALNSTVEMVEDLFFADLAARVQQQLLNSRDAESVVAGNDANRSRVQFYEVSPYLVQRFGGFGVGQARYTAGYVATEDDEVSESFNQELALSLASGPDFPWLGWTVAGSTGVEQRSDEEDVTTSEVSLGVEYPLLRTLSLIGSVGYERFDADDPEVDFSGPTWSAGFHWRPSPRADFSATYGRQDDDDSIAADLSYRLGGRTAITASYSETVETAQDRLSFAPPLDPDDPSQFLDGPVADFLDRNDTLFTLTDTITRARVFQLGLTTTVGRNAFTVSASRVNETSVGDESIDEDAWEAGAGWTRRLTPDLTFGADVSYEHATFEEAEPRKDDTVALGLSLSYQLYENVSLSVAYQYQQVNSDDEDSEFTENAIVVGVTATF